MLYTRRQTLAALVCDFPADETLVNGLKGMQGYFTTHGNTVEIPVLKVMNTAHSIIARMFNTLDFPMIRCDAIAYEQMSGNPQLTALTLIVLAEMLARTDGSKARACRATLLEQRSDDFFEGMSLYEQFLDAGDAHFAEEDFLIDLMDNINILRAENERLKQELKRQKQTMEMNQFNQYNGPVYQGCTFNNTTNNNYYTAQAEHETSSEGIQAEDMTPTATPQVFRHITQKCINEHRVEIVDAEIRAACKGTAEMLWRTLWDNENLGYVTVQPIDATTLYHDIENQYGKLPYSDRQFRSARNKR